MFSDGYSTNDKSITELAECSLGDTLKLLRKNTLIEPIPNSNDYWIVALPAIQFHEMQNNKPVYHIVDIYDPNLDPNYRGNKKDLLGEEKD